MHRGSRIRCSSKSWFIFSYFKCICYLTPQPSLFGFNSGEHLSKWLSLNWMRLSGELCTGLFIFMNQRLFPETAVTLLSSNSVLWPIHKKALGTIELWRRRLTNSTFAGWAILGACCGITNTAKWPQRRETNMLSSFKKGKRKTWEQNTPLISKAWQSWCSIGHSHWAQ